MANNCGAPCAHIVYILITINIPGVRALNPIKDDRLTSHRLEGTYRRVHTSWHDKLKWVKDKQVIIVHSNLFC